MPLKTGQDKPERLDEPRDLRRARRIFGIEGEDDLRSVLAGREDVRAHQKARLEAPAAARAHVEGEGHGDRHDHGTGDHHLGGLLLNEVLGVGLDVVADVLGLDLEVVDGDAFRCAHYCFHLDLIAMNTADAMAATAPMMRNTVA